MSRVYRIDSIINNDSIVVCITKNGLHFYYEDNVLHRVSYYKIVKSVFETQYSGLSMGLKFYTL